MIPGEIDSPQYDTLGRLTERSMIPDFFFGKIQITRQNILTHLPVAQARMMKKIEGQKSRWNVPLTRIRKSHMNPRAYAV